MLICPLKQIKVYHFFLEYYLRRSLNTNINCPVGKVSLTEFHAES